MIAAFLILLTLVAICGALLGYFAQRFKVQQEPLAEKIEEILPQTQCGQCGFAGCKPYAKAIADGSADINLCPPGGQAGIDKIAQLLGVQSKQLNEEHGVYKLPQVAFVIEQWCIGCTRCTAACPVDAIVGSAQKMHTIIMDECTGCELCLTSCPVDCIVMRTPPANANDWIWPKPLQAPLRIEDNHKNNDDNDDATAKISQ